jgi:hypothetical protein
MNPSGMIESVLRQPPLSKAASALSFRHDKSTRKLPKDDSDALTVVNLVSKGAFK